MISEPAGAGTPGCQEAAADGKGGWLTWRAPTWPGLRDGILFFAGLAGVAFETLLRRPPDYGLLPLFAAMVGLPAFIKKDTDGSKHQPRRGRNDEG